MSAHMPVTPPQARPGIYLASYPVRCPVKQRTGRVFAGCSGHRDGQPLDHWHQGSDWPTLAAKKWTQPDRSFSCHMIACNPEHAEAKPSSKRTTAVTSLDRFGEKAPHQVSFFFFRKKGVPMFQVAWCEAFQRASATAKSLCLGFSCVNTIYFYISYTIGKHLNYIIFYDLACQWIYLLLPEHPTHFPSNPPQNTWNIRPTLRLGGLPPKRPTSIQQKAPPSPADRPIGSWKSWDCDAWAPWRAEPVDHRVSPERRDWLRWLPDPDTTCLGLP